MQFFTAKALNSHEGYQKACDSYWQHIRQIRSKLPASLFNLHNNYSLHDAEIASITELHRSDLMLVLDGCRNGSLEDTDRVAYVLHFIDAHYSKRSLNHFVGTEILYTEISKGDSKKWRLSASTTRESRNDVIVIEFNDFGHYLHDYRSGP